MTRPGLCGKCGQIPLSMQNGPAWCACLDMHATDCQSLVGGVLRNPRQCDCGNFYSKRPNAVAASTRPAASDGDAGGRLLKSTDGETPAAARTPEGTP